jgi:hypothetical protein
MAATGKRAHPRAAKGLTPSSQAPQAPCTHKIIPVTPTQAVLCVAQAAKLYKGKGHGGVAPHVPAHNGAVLAKQLLHLVIAKVRWQVASVDGGAGWAAAAHGRMGK